MGGSFDESPEEHNSSGLFTGGPCRAQTSDDYRA